MKIRVITQGPWCLSYGGAEVQAKKYVEYGQQIGLNIDLIDYYDRSLDFDIIHFVGLGYSTLAQASFARKANKKVVISPVYYTSKRKELILTTTLRLTQSSHIFSLNFFRNALKVADAILPNSQAEQNQIARIFGLDSFDDRFQIIFNGVDRQSIIPNDKEFRQVFSIIEPYFLCVGMIDQRKNTKKLIEGFIAASSSAKLVLIGDFRDSDVDYNFQIKRMIDMHNKRIMHIPFIADRSLLYSAYAGAIAHILPSFIETPGLSNLEAQAVGCPLIVGDCLPVREYFGPNAVYVCPGDAKTLTKAIDNLSYEKYSFIKDIVPEKYYWDQIIRKLEVVYVNLFKLI